jgi:restriction system protein
MSDAKRMWMVRAGEGGFLINEFIENNLVAIGWNELQDLNQYSDVATLKEAFRSTYPECKDGKVNISAGQIFRFLYEFSIGEYVITYNPSERVYWVGELVSKYFRSEEVEYFNQRSVTWKGKVNRDDLSVTTKNCLGSIATIFEVSEDARSEILAVLLGEKSDSPEKKENDDELDTIRNDFIEKSHEFIKDRILRLDWEEMQDLVAAVLRAMGYKTRVSPKGSDRGKDIIASPDGLGLEDPRIIVEVKHRQGSIGSQEIRSFIGGIRTGDKGVYVSTGGFTKDSKYEADRANVPVTLIDSDYLVELIIQNYDNFDSDGKALVPLKKLYWPM